MLQNRAYYSSTPPPTSCRWSDDFVPEPTRSSYRSTDIKSAGAIWWRSQDAPVAVVSRRRRSILLPFWFIVFPEGQAGNSTTSRIWNSRATSQTRSSGCPGGIVRQELRKEQNGQERGVSCSPPALTPGYRHAATAKVLRGFEEGKGKTPCLETQRRRSVNLLCHRALPHERPQDLTRCPRKLDLPLSRWGGFPLCKKQPRPGESCLSGDRNSPECFLESGRIGAKRARKTGF